MSLSYSSPTMLVRRYWPLLTLLALTLFPFGWLGDHWPAFGALLNALFATAREHAVGHTALFVLVGMALLLVFPGLRVRAAHYAALILAIGIGQELFQLAYKQRRLVYDDFRDIATDLLGAAIAWMVVMVVRAVTRVRDGGPHE